MIPKPAKPRYDVVKSLRMIALLLTFAKLLERIIMRRFAVILEFGETQFGSQRKRGTHDAMANVLELLHQNAGMHKDGCLYGCGRWIRQA